MFFTAKNFKLEKNMAQIKTCHKKCTSKSSSKNFYKLLK